MSTHAAVEVFLGKPIEVPSERQFLVRLRRDLHALGVSARILANLQVGRYGDRQVDFVVITEHRTMVTELKTYPGPIVSGPRNGRWRVRIGAGTVKDRRNPLEQALSASQYFSDELHGFAERADAPGPTGPKFWSDLDAVACVFPTLPKGSTWEPIKHVELIGYDALLDRLQTAGPSLRWSPQDWDRFVQHLNLYRDDEDAPENLIRQAGAAAVDAYTGLFREANTDAVPPRADTAVMVDGTPAARPDMAAMLASGSTVLLRGQSGTGKTLWAQTIAVQLAESGHVPIWIEADMCDGAFLTACAQAVAPYTALNVNELLKAADASGRAVVFIVDDLSKISAVGRRRLLDGLRTAQVRAAGRGLLVTDQEARHASQLGRHADVELLLPDNDGRRAVLAAYGQADLIDRCEAFVTPLELSVAARCADDLGPELSHAELFDAYVDKLTLDDPLTRGGLRSIAARMTADLRPFQRRGDVTRRLRRELGMSDEQLRRVLDCDLLVAARGRISFRHEQFERLLAAEALLLDETDPAVLSRRLNSPSASGLRRDAIALEGDRVRLQMLLSLCEDADVLVGAANGRLGAAAANVVAGVFVDALDDACARTTAPGIRLRVTADVMRGCAWEMPSPATRAQTAQLAAIGQLLAEEGMWVNGIDVLLRHTDQLCARVVEEADPKMKDAWAGHVFAATYALAPSGGLPATPLVEAAVDHFRFRADDAKRVQTVVDRLLPHEEEPGQGALWIAAHLLRDPALPLRVDVITHCVGSTPYHLRLAGLQLAEDRSGRLTDAQREGVVNQIEALSTNNLALSGAQLEALAALGGVQPAKTEEDIAAEIKSTLSMRGDPQADRLAYGIISSQFENEIVGPYYEVVSTLPPEQRLQLLAMALNGCEYGWTTDAFILDEIAELTVPEIRDAVSRYVARFNPDECMSPQFAMQAMMRATTLLTRAGLPVPESSVGERDPGWQCALELMRAAAGDEDEALADAWEKFAVEHSDAVASLVGKFKSVRRMNEGGALLDRLESTMPQPAVDALVAALEHPERVRSVGGRDFDLRRDIVARLTEIGGRQAAKTLRRFADDPEIGRAAAEAVRAIEARIS
ncbi:MAG: NERD domain-containing protein [Thermoleophilaceae bacterium]